MKYPLTKSQAAFLFSFDRLQAISNQLYFWTFTASTSSHDWEFSHAWHYFQKRLDRYYDSSLFGLRVFERHPGPGPREGELHCHCVVNLKVSIWNAKRLARGSGIGQIMWVRKAWPGLNDYLAKYLNKQRKLTGIRSWARFGMWDHCTVNGVEVNSAETRLYKSVYTEFRGSQHAWINTRVKVAKIKRELSTNFDLIINGQGVITESRPLSETGGMMISGNPF
jgi:hypothetical protein